METHVILDNAECWCVGLSGLYTSCSIVTGAYDPGRGYASPSGLNSKDRLRSEDKQNRKPERLIYPLPVVITTG